jgi:hypothetical protein
MQGEDPYRQASANDNPDFKQSLDIKVQHFQRGTHRWEYEGHGLEESYSLLHPESNTTLALIERHDRRKGYFDGNVELSLRNFKRGIFSARYHDMSLRP